MHRADPPRGNEMQTDPASVLPNQCSPKRINATMCSKMQLIVAAIVAGQFAQDIPENGYFGESEKRPAKSRRTTKGAVRLRQWLDDSARLPVAKANGPPKRAIRCGARRDLGGAPSCEAELGESNSKERERRGFG